MFEYGSEDFHALDRAEQAFRIAWSVRSIDRLTVRQTIRGIRDIRARVERLKPARSA